MKTISLVAVSAVLLGAIPCTQANEPPTVRVQYYDLNLDHPAGAKSLYGRLQKAAARVCEPYSASLREVSRYARYQACISDAIARAVAEVNRPILTRYADEKSSRRKRTRFARD